MRARLTGVLAVAALTLPATIASAQDPVPTTPTPTPTASPSPSATPTPTPTSTPTPEEQERAERDERDRNSKPVRRIYRDFQRDGRIDDCDHTAKALKRARRSIEDSYKEEYPDFRDALTAALERHRSGRCEEQQAERDEATSDPTPEPTATPAPAAPPAPPAAPPAAPPPPPDSGSLPDFGSGGGSGGSGGDVEPLPAPGEDAIPEGTPSPSPVPQATPTPPPKLVVSRASASPNLFVPGALLAVALAGLLIAALSALFAKRTGRLEGVGHAWREAAWRASGTWSEFTDWLRSGR